MKTLSFSTLLIAFLAVQPGWAQVLTTGEPATANNETYVIPSDPKSMTVADENASKDYIIGKRVYPDQKKNQAQSSTAESVRDTPAMKLSDKPTMKRKSRQGQKPQNKPNPGN